MLWVVSEEKVISLPVGRIQSLNSLLYEEKYIILECFGHLDNVMVKG